MINRVTELNGTDEFNCVCDCGNNVTYTYRKLSRNRIKSCGCLRNGSRFLHGMSDSIEYKSWEAMIDRCYNSKNTHYKRYGGRGISVCDKWRYSFHEFLKDIGRRPHLKYTLDRINNELNYTPDNCKWSTKTEQSFNKSNNILIEYNGHIKNLSVWAKEININSGTLSSRLKGGWTIEDSLNRPAGHRKQKPICSSKGCQNISDFKNYCIKHYMLDRNKTLKEKK